MNEQTLAVQKMQQYIHRHIREEISMKELSEISCYSPWYARKIFLAYTKLSPADYIRRLKLSKSALMLRDEKCKVIDVALEWGFGSVDGYQRAFRKEFGCNPKEYANRPVPLYLFTPYLVNSMEIERKSECMKEVRNIYIQVIQKPKRKVIIRRGIHADDYASYCKEVGCDVWGLLSSIKSLEGEPVCLWLPKKYRDPVTNEYVQGAEVEFEYNGIVPEGCDVITLPSATYLMFQGQPFEEECYAIAIEEIWKAEREYNPAFIRYEWDDENPRIQLEPIGTRGYIEFMPVKKLER